MAKDHETTSKSNDDGSTHYTKYSDGSHRSYDKDESGNKSNDHFTDHSSGKHYYSQDTNDGRHKADDVTDSKGNNVSRPSITDFHTKHDSDSDSGSGGGGGGCFITTATLSAIGKTDNCDELNSFRNFRDHWLANQVDGQELISEYYNIAPKIVEAINSRPDSENVYRSLWSSSIKPCLGLIQSNSFSEAKAIYCQVVVDLKKNYLDTSPNN